MRLQPQSQPLREELISNLNEILSEIERRIKTTDKTISIPTIEYLNRIVQRLYEINEIIIDLISDVKKYSFIDVGSGKGKVLINNIIKNTLYNKNIGIFFSAF